MKKSLGLIILLFTLLNVNAQKCDTLSIDGAPNPYGCPEKALNIYKGIFNIVSKAMFEPLNNATINYCDDCPLQDWSFYHFENKWSNNPFRFSNEVEYNWKAIPTAVPCSEEREPALFLGNIYSYPLIGFYANLPSIYFSGANTLNNIYQNKADSSAEVYQKKGLNFGDIYAPLFKEYGAAALLLGDESDFHKSQSNFSIEFWYNKTSLNDPVSKTDILKTTPFKLNAKFTIPYTAYDNLRDVSNFQENEDMKLVNDYTKKPTINSPLGKQFESIVQLGQVVQHSKTESLRANADYRVFNFVVIIHGISFEKNHEILNAIDWNLLNTIINSKSF